jgi:homoserine dehydrogenase
VTPDFDAVHCEGIRDVASVDIACANELGYKIKLLGIAHRGASGIEQTVYPALIKHNHPLATIGDVQNAVAIEAEPVGSVMLTGPGAGEGPTASSVVSDICDIARNLILPTFGQKMSSLNTMQSRSIDAHEGGYYIRLHVEDQPGVLARISDCLSDQSISIESIIQKPCDQGSAYVVVLTHLTNEVAMQASLAALKALPAVREIPLMLRVA